ncbi:hypothetical protein [Sorangium sp. So ce513]|uniref:hypothetical protein n=1 Tax=Sorangium sp. So ce513 TaxID=3133315 RepID=UPI003F5F44D2
MNRFAYWPVRADKVGELLKGGELLAPGTPLAPIRIIDVRETGIESRAVQQTVEDTLSRWKTAPPERRSERRSRLRAGLSPEREAAGRLGAWRAARATGEGRGAATVARPCRLRVGCGSRTPADVAPLEEPAVAGDDPSMVPYTSTIAKELLASEGAAARTPGALCRHPRGRLGDRDEAPLQAG